MSETLEITLPSKIGSVEEVATAAEEFVASRGLGDEMAYAVDMAVREAVANAVKHGNKLDGSKNVEVTLADTGDAIEVTVRDHGAGFDVEGVPDPTDPEHLLCTNGRGILFMRSFMDEVEWTNAPDGGLMVKMAKVKK